MVNNMKIIGRTSEQQKLQNSLLSERPEFIVVYGRRRVGKTFLIKEYFNYRFSFYATGVAKLKMKDQLKVFREALAAYGDSSNSIPEDWFAAFSRLKAILERKDVFRDPVSGRRVVFLDELPWMDTPRSDFVSALDYFWNSWGSSQQDLMLIVCGSATSWIIDHILTDRGGFYNRITRQIRLMPFSLQECSELFSNQGIKLSQRQIMESYMVFGGIPYYMNCFDKRLSLAQNIDVLCFREDGELYNEYDRMFQSLFRHADKHLSVISTLAKKQSGMSRAELIKRGGFNDGESMTKVLNELEQCGFLRKYQSFGNAKNGGIYQIIDPFTLFSIRFMKERRLQSWISFIGTPGYYAWSGLAFEILCLNHVDKIKEKLGISGIETKEYTWRSKTSDPGAQIDLIIDRKDDVINICEIKFSVEAFVIDAAYEKSLIHKIEAFRTETGTGKALHLTMITGSGLKHNQYSGIVQNEITGLDLMDK